MDADRFDGLVRRVSERVSRRQLLAGLLGATVAGSLGGSDAPAKAKRQHHRRHGVKAQDDTPKPNGKKCVKDEQCHSGQYCDRAGSERNMERARSSRARETARCRPARRNSSTPVRRSKRTVTVQDTGSGLASIEVTQSENADTIVPPVTEGTTDPVVVTVTTIDQSEAVKHHAAGDRRGRQRDHL